MFKPDLLLVPQRALQGRAKKNFWGGLVRVAARRLGCQRAAEKTQRVGGGPKHLADML